MPKINKNLFNNKTVLITGGTGSLGKNYTRFLLENYNPKKIIIFSRDEFKQFQMEKEFKEYNNIRFFLGDVRDASRLKLAFYDVDIIIHAAALKQIPAMEYNPSEAIQTNIYGTQNVIYTALEEGVDKVLLVSTDKAVNPVNLYGATKMSAEKLFVASNAYTGKRVTKFSAVRYGNVINSRGSVIETILKDCSNSPLTLTDKEMTRFWITLEECFNLINFSLQNMKGGEIFIPKVPSMKVPDLFKALAPSRKVKTTGIRPGEKLHEVLLSNEEAIRSYDIGDYFVILPSFSHKNRNLYSNYKTKDKPLKKDFSYSSDNNKKWLTEKQLRKILNLK